MSRWGYRVLKKKWNEEFTSYAVCEVYYDDEDKPTSWTWDKNVMNRYSYEDLRSNIDLIRQAFEQPVLQIVGDDEFLQEINPEDASND
ncbi:hypothetical protein ACFFSY_00895 [Paenibacillus aurantiacus]|uniref:Uncharacterized protein n=1 Tax=Paenibacillus aurantiacus TaxID=1936118 RepID=A0ABV5KHY6_9BACL